MKKRDYLHNYEPVKTLGSGAYGDVVQFMDKTDGSFVAIKMLKTRIIDMTSSELLSLKRELEFLFTLNHPLILSLKFCVIYSQRVFIATDIAEKGCLLDYIISNQQC